MDKVHHIRKCCALNCINNLASSTSPVCIWLVHANIWEKRMWKIDIALENACESKLTATGVWLQTSALLIPHLGALPSLPILPIDDLLAGSQIFKQNAKILLA